MLIIGMGHKLHNGKDTAVAAIIEANPDIDIRRYAFADAIKEEIAGREFELCMKYGLKFEPDNKHRTLLQHYGMLRRKQDRLYWINKLEAKLKHDKPEVALISDLRFHNEAAFVKQSGGYTIRLLRVGYRDLSIASEHVSEHELDNYQFDMTIDVMDGEVDVLRQSAIAAFDIIVDYVKIPTFEDI